LRRISALGRGRDSSFDARGWDCASKYTGRTAEIAIKFFANVEIIGNQLNTVLGLNSPNGYSTARSAREIVPFSLFVRNLGALWVVGQFDIQATLAHFRAEPLWRKKL
jgi:hypothetical protein